MEILVAILVAICVYFVFVALFPKAVTGGFSDHTREALERIYQENRGEAQAQEIAVLKEQLGEEAPWVRGLFSPSFMRPLYEAGLQSGYAPEMKSYAVLVVLSALGITLMFSFIGFGWFAFIMGPMMGYLIPMRQCTKRIQKRNRKFLDQFPDALDMIVRSVKSGFPMNTALLMLAENAEEPVKGEFRQVVDELSAGRSVPQALQRLALRINEQDLKFFTVVLSVQQETGGNLAEIVGNLSSVLRKRKQLRHKIHALTSEGRATAWVLGLLPVLVFAALWFIQRDYVMVFFTDPTGLLFFGIVLFLIGLCAFIVKQMINVDI